MDISPNEVDRYRSLVSGIDADALKEFEVKSCPRCLYIWPDDLPMDAEHNIDCPVCLQDLWIADKGDRWRANRSKASYVPTRLVWCR